MGAENSVPGQPAGANHFGQLMSSMLNNPEIMQGLTQVAGGQMQNMAQNGGLAQAMGAVLGNEQIINGMQGIMGHTMSPDAKESLGDVVKLMSSTSKALVSKERKDKDTALLQQLVIQTNDLRRSRAKESIFFDAGRYRIVPGYSLSFLEDGKVTSSNADRAFVLTKGQVIPFYYPCQFLDAKQKEEIKERASPYSRILHNREAMHSFLLHFFNQLTVDPQGTFQLSKFYPQLTEDSKYVCALVEKYLPTDIAQLATSYANSNDLLLYFSHVSTVIDNDQPDHPLQGSMDLETLAIALDARPYEVHSPNNFMAARVGLYYLHHNPQAMRQPHALITRLAEKMGTSPYLAVGGILLLWIVKNDDIEFRFDFTGLSPAEVRREQLRKLYDMDGSSPVDIREKEARARTYFSFDDILLDKGIVGNAVVGKNIYLCDSPMVELFLSHGMELVQTWKAAVEDKTILCD